MLYEIIYHANIHMHHVSLLRFERYLHVIHVDYDHDQVQSIELYSHRHLKNKRTRSLEKGAQIFFNFLDEK